MKLEADPDLALPDLAGVIDGVTAVELATKRLDATYFDAEDLRLLDGGVTARRRTGEGTRWTVKLASAPTHLSDQSHGSDAPVLNRREVDVFDDATEPPAAVVDLVAFWLDRAPLLPIARLVTERHRIELRSPAGVALAEVDDDLVTVHDPDGQGSAGQFHEIEIELAATGTDDEVGAAALLDGVVARLVAAGARAAPPQSKVARALGLLGRR